MRRNAALDYARLIAAFGIIVFHIGAPGAKFGYAALPFFLMVLLILAGPSALRQDFKSYARSRASRLLRPWLIWSIIYALLKIAEITVTGADFSSEFMPWMILTGPALHLWFLPFAFIACVSMWPFARKFSFDNLLWRIIGALLGFSSATAVLVMSQDRALDPPFAQWVYAIPAVFIGYAFYLLTASQKPALLSLLGFCYLYLTLSFLDWPNGATQIVLAAGAFVACLAIRLPDHAVAKMMASLSLTVYLSHPMIIALLLRTTSIPANSLTMLAMAVIGSTAFALALERCSSRIRSHTQK